MDRIVRCKACSSFCKEEHGRLRPASHEDLAPTETEREVLSQLRALGMRLRLGGPPDAVRITREKIDEIVIGLADTRK